MANRHVHRREFFKGKSSFCDAASFGNEPVTISAILYVVTYQNV